MVKITASLVRTSTGVVVVLGSMNVVLPTSYLIVGGAMRKKRVDERRIDKSRLEKRAPDD